MSDKPETLEPSVVSSAPDDLQTSEVAPAVPLNKAGQPQVRNRGRFVKGNKEGNRYKKGETGNPLGTRIDSHERLRGLVQRIGSEVVNRRKGTQRVEQMLRDMFEFGNASDRAVLLERGWGKVPDEVRVKTWRDEIIELMRQGLITAEVVRKELPEPEANQVIAMAGFAILRDGARKEAEDVIEGRIVGAAEGGDGSHHD